MKCLYCGGTLRKGKTSYTVNRKGYHLIIDEVPAWICEQCGEVMFDESVVEAIQDLIREVDSRVETLVPAFA